MTANFARTERAGLCDLFEKTGPDEPTLCEGWTTRDLAAHVVVRDRRPDAAAGIMLKPFAGHTENVRRAAARRPFDQLIDEARRPPRLSLAGIGPLDRLTNTAEFFIHHEDARRGQPDWEPRELPRDLSDTLYRQLRLMGKLRIRRLPAAVTIDVPGFGQIRGGRGGPALSISGDPGELTLYFAGRKDAARVTIDGPPELTAKLRAANYRL